MTTMSRPRAIAPGHLLVDLPWIHRPPVPVLAASLATLIRPMRLSRGDQQQLLTALAQELARTIPTPEN